jgi:hypothetical protein
MCVCGVLNVDIEVAGDEKWMWGCGNGGKLRLKFRQKGAE